MKRKKLSIFIAAILTMALIFTMTAPLAVASNVTIEFLNPLGQIDMLDNLPLAERRPWQLDENGKLTERIVVGLPTNGTLFPQIAIAMHLIDLYGRYNEIHPGAGIVLVTSAFGGNWSSNTDASQDFFNNSPDGLAAGGLGGLSVGGAAVPTYVVAPAGVLPSVGEWNLRYSSHPNMNPITGATTGTINFTGDIDVQLAGTAI
ncbi:MAG: hypothetical protein FWC75_05605 [Oscillospiraceae bacterium]|nr:hypothetical protein [Oscillospiraceae bacterium]